MKKTRIILITGIATLILAVIFTILLSFGIDDLRYHAYPLTKDGVLDESCCGSKEIMCNHCPEDWKNNKISFSTLNDAVSQIFPPSWPIYKMTNYLGYIPILCAGAYCIFGIAQLVKRKSLKKVDKGLFVLAGLFIVTLACYFLFEKLAINYRPVKINGELEASYPSSHTMLTICISFGIILLNRVVYNNKKQLKYLNMTLVFITAFVVAGRLFSGVHWATDIIGGLLFSVSFVLIYYSLLLITCQKHDKIEKTKKELE